MIRTKRVYEVAASDDGIRILIDRLWPRGLTKAKAQIGEWKKELAPSDELRRWFGHDPAKFPRFRARYRAELLRHREALAELVLKAERHPVTLLYAAKDRAHCNATVLKELLEENLE